MHREKCAWGQTGQKNVMALLVPMAEPLPRVETLVDARLTSNPWLRDAAPRRDDFIAITLAPQS